MSHPVSQGAEISPAKTGHEGKDETTYARQEGWSQHSVTLGAGGQAGPQLPPLDAGRQGWARRVAQLERHLRENRLRQHASLSEELGRTGGDVRSAAEARRIAFDIFWNVRTDYSR